MDFILKLLDAADEFVSKSSWRDMALLKCCLFAAGLMIGLAIPKRLKGTAAVIAMLIFIPTYLVLMLKFLPMLSKKCGK